jgi:(p)ppGpp synthase/HD superfamily hydrolase
MSIIRKQHSLIEKAIEIALKAHANQIDKAGAPYILHPLRIMLQMQSDDEKAIAILHDVVEDGQERGFSLDYLRKAGFPKVVIESVQILTHKNSDNYDDYIAKIKLHPVARHIKIADLRDNMDIKRIPYPAEKDFMRLEKYKRAIKLLEENE